MQRLLAKVVCDGEYRVIHDEDQGDKPFRVYHIWNEVAGECGLRRRKKQVQRFQHYSSAMRYIAEVVSSSSWEVGK